MPHYRVHILDSCGKVIGAGRFECIDTETAQERIRMLAGDLETELWRLVARFDSSVGSRSGANQVGLRNRRRLHS